MKPSSDLVPVMDGFSKKPDWAAPSPLPCGTRYPGRNSPWAALMMQFPLIMIAHVFVHINGCQKRNIHGGTNGGLGNHGTLDLDIVQILFAQLRWWAEMD